MLALRQARFRAGGRNGFVDDLRVAQGRNSFLGCQHRVAHGALFAGCQTGLDAGRRHSLFHDFLFVGQHLDDFLLLKHFIANRAMLALRQAGCRAGGRNGYVDNFRVAQGRNNLLPDKHFIADGAMLALRQTGCRAGGSHSRVSNGHMIRMRDFDYAGSSLTAFSRSADGGGAIGHRMHKTGGIHRGNGFIVGGKDNQLVLVGAAAGGDGSLQQGALIHHHVLRRVFKLNLRHRIAHMHKARAGDPGIRGNGHRSFAGELAGKHAVFIHGKPGGVAAFPGKAARGAPGLNVLHRQLTAGFADHPDFRFVKREILDRRIGGHRHGGRRLPAGHGDGGLTHRQRGKPAVFNSHHLRSGAAPLEHIALIFREHRGERVHGFIHRQPGRFRQRQAHGRRQIHVIDVNDLIAILRGEEIHGGVFVAVNGHCRIKAAIINANVKLHFTVVIYKERLYSRAI